MNITQSRYQQILLTVFTVVLGFLAQPAPAFEKEAKALVIQFYALEKAQSYPKAAALFSTKAKISIVWSFGSKYPEEKATLTPSQWVELMKATDAELAQYSKGYRETARETKIISSRTKGSVVEIQASVIIRFVYDGKVGKVEQDDTFIIRKINDIIRLAERKSVQDLRDLL